MSQNSCRMHRIGRRIGFSNPYDATALMFKGTQWIVVGGVGVFARTHGYITKRQFQ